MDLSDILLIIISSAGLLHGILFATYLCFFKKKRKHTNIFLGLMLYFMAFRIGKSVLLNFGSDLEPIFIFAGLSFLLLIGPLLRWYLLAMTKPNFNLPKYYLIELIPFLIIFILSFFVTKIWFESNSKEVIIVFASVIIFIYLHLATYIYLSWRVLHFNKKTYKTILLTKSQKAVFSWLQLLIIGFILIWISYCLNIIEDTIPYVVGPIVYSIVIYFLSYKAFELKILDLDGTIFKKSDDAILFEQISKLIIENKLYLDAQLTLSGLAQSLGKSTQKTSEIINQYARQNFNDFINYYRIQDAKQLLVKDAVQNYTIASVAFDVGFSSLSSFNSAFKKFEKTTPSAFRKNAL
ncbi:helix-turn-helix domain-containing protein [uncultured Psychroserpens sp.]|uniref:AraC family transcriptional regulator n=1 Tax=uncultured Psychroserpens sp. TaxID=255436 RepID=UPI00262D54AF|nr:helix-turn-helix domain-containing protein [uncultured Psychroserpens sp.]